MLETCRVADDSRQHTMRPATLYSLAWSAPTRARSSRPGNWPARRSLYAIGPGTFRPGPWSVCARFIVVSLDDAKAAHSHLGPLADVVSAIGSRYQA